MKNASNIDFEKAWKNTVCYFASTPLRFLIQAAFLYNVLPTFFGSTFTSGFWSAVYATGATWLAMLGMLLFSAARMHAWNALIKTVNPTLAEQDELKRRRLANKNLDDTFADGRNRAVKLSLKQIKQLPVIYLRYVLIFAVFTKTITDVFANGSAESVLKFAAVFTVFDWVLNLITAILVFKDFTKKPLSEEDGASGSATKRGAFSEMVAEAQETQSIELARYDFAIELNPTSDAFLQRGIAYLKAREPIPAIDDFERVMEIDPLDAEAWEYRADAYQFMNMDNLARNDLLHAIRIAATKENLETKTRLERKLALCGTSVGFESITGASRSPGFFAAMKTLVNPNSTAIAEESLNGIDKDLQAKVRSAVVYLRQGSALFQKADYQGALSAANKSIEFCPDSAQGYALRAKIQVQLLDLESALKDYDTAIRFDPENNDAWLERTRIKSVLGDHDGTIKDCTHAINFSKNMNLKLMRATSLLALNRDDEAIVDVDEFIKSWEGCIAVWDAMWLPACRAIADGLSVDLHDAYIARATIYGRRGDLDASAQDTIRATKLKRRIAKSKSKGTRKLAS